MLKTIDYYSIKRQMTDSDSEHISPNVKTLENIPHDSLISIFNSCNVSSNVNEYLFKSDKEIGTNVIKLIYRNINKPYLFICYTNLHEIFHSRRMIQDIWAFDTLDEVNANMSAMQDICTYVSNTHLFQLPQEVDFESNVSSLFKDPYFNSEHCDYLNDVLAKAKDAERKYEARRLKNMLDVSYLPNTYLEHVKNRENGMYLYIRGLDYNERVHAYYKHREQASDYRELVYEARGLTIEFQSFYHNLNKSGTPEVTTIATI